MLIRAGWPAASWPGIRLSPSTLIAKIRISVISGARIRRSTRKMVADACTPETTPVGSRRLECRSSVALLTGARRSGTAEGAGLDDQQHQRDHVRQQRTTGQRDDAGGGLCGEPRAGDVRGERPEDGG